MAIRTGQRHRDLLALPWDLWLDTVDLALPDDRTTRPQQQGGEPRRQPASPARIAAFFAR